VSKAFTKDDDGPGELLVVPRAPLPAGLPNYVTPRGLAALHAELALLDRARAAIDLADPAERARQLQALAQRAAELESRIGAAEVVEPSAQPHDQVRFGATVRVEHSSGKEHEYQIVGVDEADAELGRVAFSAPLARALLGARVGDSVEFRTPRASEELRVLGICYDGAPSSSREPQNPPK
jgi:transcription elongation factor GreB